MSLFLVAAACGSTDGSHQSGFVNPNTLMREEIQRRIDQIPYMHKEQLLDNLLWLAGQGEQVMPQLFSALRHGEPKVRSSATWCLGWMGDKRAIPELQSLSERETDEVVRLELARQLLALGDMGRVSHLIAGLESDRRHVRYLCYEALKGQTGQDFGYDHRVEDASERAASVTRWREWWTEMNTDKMLRAPRTNNAAQPPAQPPRGEGEARVPAWQGESGSQRQPRTSPEGQVPPAQFQSGTQPPPVDSPNAPQSGASPAGKPSTWQPSTPLKEPAAETRPTSNPTSRPAESAEVEFK